MPKMSIQDLKSYLTQLQNLPDNKEAYAGFWLGVASGVVSAFAFRSPPKGIIHAVLTLAGFSRLGEARAYWERRAIDYRNGRYTLPENKQFNTAFQFGLDQMGHFLPLVAALNYKGLSGIQEFSIFTMCTLEMALPLTTQIQMHQLKSVNPHLDAIVQHETYQDKNSAHNWFGNLSLGGIAVIFLYALYDLLQTYETDEEIFFLFMLASHLLNNYGLEQQLPTFSRHPSDETKRPITFTREFGVSPMIVKPNSVVISMLDEMEETDVTLHDEGLRQRKPAFDS